MEQWTDNISDPALLIMHQTMANRKGVLTRALGKWNGISDSKISLQGKKYTGDEVKLMLSRIEESITFIIAMCNYRGLRYYNYETLKRGDRWTAKGAKAYKYATKLN